jgi:hypothetical protein
MKNNINLLFYIFLILLFPLEGKGVTAEGKGKPSTKEESGQTAVLLAQLDSAITHIKEYDEAHEKNIEAIKERLHHRKGGLAEEISLTDKLIEAYSKFNYDSTTLYINRNLQLAEQSGNQGVITRMKLLKAQYYAKTGSYLEAVNIISKIDEQHLPDTILPLFYDACRHVYGESGYYSHDSEINASYLDKAGQYRFLLQQYYSKLPESDIYLETLETFARNKQDYEEALKYSDKRLELIDSMSKKYSEVAYFRSLIYKGLGEKEKEKQWLIRSAIGDLRHSIKDQASLWTLADMLSGDGDVKRSYLLINISQDGLQQYNSPLRNLQSIDILNNIAHNYQQMTNNQNHKLSIMLLLVGVLALLLGIAVLYVIRQMRKLRVARRELDENNQKLIKLNNELQQTIEKLHESYNLLNESNRMKEVYLGNFLALCSDYITKIEAFRSTVLKKQKSGQLSSFLSPSKMREMKSKDCNELLGNFDVAFLNIIPSFIDEFNALLQPESRITPPNSNSLTTELRIFALIRMGITDSSKIAEFLNYSVHTIYNYRSTVKNAAIGPRDEFEDAVKQIGTTQQPF